MADSEHIDNKDVLLKEAADALDSAQLEKKAIKLAYDMIERGKIAPFANYAEYQEKVASLMDKDLRVVEEALSMDVDMPDFGKVASSGGQPQNAEQAFFHRLAED